jgi:hypothetical protein
MKLRLPIALLSVLALLVSGPGPAQSTPSDPADRAAGSRVVKPGQVGKAMVGMTVAEAMATGQFDKNVANPPCDPVRLQPKGAWRNQYVVFARARIKEMAVFGTRPRTKAGLGVGSTVREVREVYGKRISAPRVAGFDQWALYVRRGKGTDRKWLGFLFGKTTAPEGKLRPRHKVTLMGVTKGKRRPALMLDGC